MQILIDTIIALSGIALILTFISIDKKPNKLSWYSTCVFFGLFVASFIFTIGKLIYELL